MDRVYETHSPLLLLLHLKRHAPSPRPRSAPSASSACLPWAWLGPERTGLHSTWSSSGFCPDESQTATPRVRYRRPTPEEEAAVELHALEQEEAAVELRALEQEEAAAEVELPVLELEVRGLQPPVEAEVERLKGHKRELR